MNMSDKVYGNKGKTLSEEHKRKTGEAAKRRKFSDEARRSISEARKGRKNPFYGKTHSEKAKDKLSTARVNQKLPIKDIKPEIILQQICNDEGIEFITQKTICLQHYDWHNTRRHNVDVFIDSTEPNICLFADGDYWHANPNPYKRYGSIKRGIKPDTVLVTSSKEKKFAKDIRERDDGITRDLESQGYIVLRFWTSELLYNTETCRQEIIDVVMKRKESLA
ncbi:MAG: DUF559 domain-containing protein [Thaumarchaeota archaeon]|nr:DUF559 domain-containing protein [Nitrososphaerota archaeon]